MDTNLHIVYPEGNGKYSFKTILLNTQPICGLLAKNDKVLMIGGYNQKILYFKIEDENLLSPELVREAIFDFNVTCIAPFDLKG